MLSRGQGGGRIARVLADERTNRRQRGRLCGTAGEEGWFQGASGEEVLREGKNFSYVWGGNLSSNCTPRC